MGEPESLSTNKWRSRERRRECGALSAGSEILRDVPDRFPRRENPAICEERRWRAEVEGAIRGRAYEGSSAIAPQAQPGRSSQGDAFSSSATRFVGARGVWRRSSLRGNVGPFWHERRYLALEARRSRVVIPMHSSPSTHCSTAYMDASRRGSSSLPGRMGRRERWLLGTDCSSRHPAMLGLH